MQGDPSPASAMEPCPFCGAPGLITRMAGVNIGSFCYQAGCAECYCSLEVIEEYEAEAVKRWNRRASPMGVRREERDAATRSDRNFIPYNADEKIVCDYLMSIQDAMGCGDDPISFLVASHNALVARGRDGVISTWLEAARYAGNERRGLPPHDAVGGYGDYGRGMAAAFKQVYEHCMAMAGRSEL